MAKSPDPTPKKSDPKKDPKEPQKEPKDPGRSGRGDEAKDVRREQREEVDREVGEARTASPDDRNETRRPGTERVARGFDEDRREARGLPRRSEGMETPGAGLGASPISGVESVAGGDEEGRPGNDRGAESLEDVPRDEIDPRDDEQDR